MSEQTEEMIPPEHALVGLVLWCRRRVAGLLGESLQAGTERRAVVSGPADPAVVVVGLGDVADDAVLRGAFAEAVARAAVLHVVHAWDAALDPAAVPVALPTRGSIGVSMTSVHRDVFAGVTSVAADYPGAQYAVIVVQGDPTTVLVERSRGASLLILGRVSPEATPDRRDRVPGGTGREVLAQVTCPVLVLDLPPAGRGQDPDHPRTSGHRDASGSGEAGALQMLAL